MRFGKVTTLTMAFTLLGASAAMAQRPATLEPGTKSISFALPGNGWGQSFGIWKMISDDTNLGINVRLNRRSGDVAGSTATKQFGLSVGPEIRYYTADFGPVVPFIYGSANIGYSKESEPGDRSAMTLGLGGGLGVEWFPLDNIGISGFTGVVLDHTRHSIRAGGSTMKQSSTMFGTVTSGLSINLYFGGRSTAVATGT